MNYENEITVEADANLQELISILTNKGFLLKEKYDLNDIYLINKADRKGDFLSMLNKCGLIRHIVEEHKETKMLTYKHKEYNENKEITKQGKIKVVIDDIEKTISMLANEYNIKHIDLIEKANMYSTKIKDYLMTQYADKEFDIAIW